MEKANNQDITSSIIEEEDTAIQMEKTNSKGTTETPTENNSITTKIKTENDIKMALLLRGTI